MESIKLTIDNSHLLSGPLHVAFDITNKCMAKCLHCYNRSGSDLSRNELSDEEIIDFIKSVADIKPYSFCFCGGEPLLKYDILLKSIEILRKGGTPRVSLVSNGYLMTREKAAALKDAGLELIQISLDGAKKETHERLRGIEGIYERAVNAIKYVNECGFALTVAFTPTKFNLDEFEDVVTFLSTHNNLVAIRVQPLMPLGRGKIYADDILPTEDQYRSLVKTIKKYKNMKNQSYTIEWGDPIDHLRRFTHMDFGQVSVVEVKSDGSISVSAYLPVKFGNIKKYSLEDYWEAGLGRVWAIPAVRELAEGIQSISDFGVRNENKPLVFFDKDIVIDLVEDKPYENLDEFSLNKYLMDRVC